MKDENLTPEEIRKKAIKRAMYLLEKQDRTEYQLRDKLKQDGYSQGDIDAAIAYVESYHYIDDERFARNYVRYRSDSKSRQQLKMALLQKGVGQDIIEIALEEEYEGDEMRQIEHWIRKKKYVPEEATPETRNKLIGFLFRKGFRMDDIKAVIGNMSSEWD